MGNKRPFDVVIIGGGPAGLTAAIHAGAEGLYTALIDSKDKLGGQARHSFRIENYPGFPDGISGKELMSNFIAQANKFKTVFIRPAHARGIKTIEGGYIEVSTDSDEHDTLITKTVIIASGLSYNRLKAEGIVELLGQGVHYGKPRIERKMEGKTLCVVGGANSSAQAVMRLSEVPGSSVKMIVRGEKLGMSQYLVDRLQATPNVEILMNTNVVEAFGKHYLEGITVDTQGVRETIETCSLSILIGASPKSQWLRDTGMELDEKGYVLTGSSIKNFPLSRTPYFKETSIPGVFSCGDIRKDGTKRVAYAVGDAANTIEQILHYIQN